MSMVRLTIVHGDLEEQADVDALQQIREAVEPGWRMTKGTNDTTVYVIDPSVLGPALATIAEYRRDWWRVVVERQES